MELSDRLVKLMKLKKIKNTDLMRFCGVSSGAVSQWRKGYSKPTNYDCLAKAFEMETEELKGYLLDGENLDFDYQKDPSIVDFINKWSLVLRKDIPKFLLSTSNVNKAIETAKEKLNDAQKSEQNYQVTPFAKGKKNSLILLNSSLWCMPSFNVYIKDQDVTFVVDIYPLKRLGVIPVLLDNKFQEILFVKETEVDNIVEMVENHIQRWFS